VSSSTVPWQRLLTVEVLQLHAVRSSLHGLPWKLTLDVEVEVEVEVEVTLRLEVYRQSVCLGVKPLETHDQSFFFFSIETLQ
jgi:hypothetical protein